MSVDLTPDLNDEERGRSESLSKQPTRPPTFVPGYDPERFLGRGAFGEVWVALDRNTGCRVAIKFFTRRSGLDWSLLAREVDKLRLLSNDRYVVRLHEVGWDADPPYYIMDYQEDGSLEDRLRQGPLPVSQAVALCRDLAIGLAHAHNRGILHCDLKPANVLLDQEGRPRLADFGQARLTDEQSAALGTMFYMAPEQADLQAVPDARWDVYALGAVFYCTLTGQPPYRAEASARGFPQTGTLQERLACYQQFVRSAPRPRAHRQVPGVDRALADIIDRCLAVLPAKRFANVQAVSNALDARALNRARRPLLVLGALGPMLLLLVMVVFAWIMTTAAVDSSNEQIVARAQAGNRFAARFAADQVAAKILQRWAILEQEAAQNELRNLLEQVRGQPKEAPRRQELLDYLDRHRARYDYAHLARTWFLVDPDGKMLASSSASIPREQFQSILDKPYWYRDYFHGRGFDYDPNRPRPEGLAPISQAHQSVIFRSTQGNEPFIVVFSVPVPGADLQHTVGVLAMAVSLGEFSELKVGDDLKWATLVQTEKDVAHPLAWSARVRNEGLILEHREFQKLMADSQKVPILHLPREDIERLHELRALKVERLRKNEKEPAGADPEFLLDDYRDPVAQVAADYAGRWLAAAEPVVFQKRPLHGGRAPGPALVDNGWVVIVQEHYDAAVHPVQFLRGRLIRQGLLALGLVLLVMAALWGFVILGLTDSSRSRVATYLRRRAGLPTGSLAGSTGSLTLPPRPQSAPDLAAAPRSGTHTDAEAAER